MYREQWIVVELGDGERFVCQVKDIDCGDTIVGEPRNYKWEAQKDKDILDAKQVLKEALGQEALTFCPRCAILNGEKVFGTVWEITHA